MTVTNHQTTVDFMLKVYLCLVVYDRFETTYACKHSVPDVYAKELFKNFEILPFTSFFSN